MVSSPIPEGLLDRDVGTSGANAAQTVSTPLGGGRRLAYVTVKYSSAVTEDVTVTLNSGAGSAYDTLLATMELANNQHGVFIPDEMVDILPDDTIDVVAPAGGAGITSAVTIYMVAQ